MFPLIWRYLFALHAGLIKAKPCQITDGEVYGILVLSVALINFLVRGAEVWKLCGEGVDIVG